MRAILMHRMKSIVKPQTVVLHHVSTHRLRTSMTITAAWLRTRTLSTALLKNTSGIAAVEFAMVLPIMLVLFFGTVEISNGVAVYRKVTLMAHTLSDLTSQSQEVQSSSDLPNFFAASSGVMMPYSSTPITQNIMEIWVNSSGQARVQWSYPTAITAGTVVTIPANLIPANPPATGTYVIYSQVSYVYTPVVGYVMSSAGVTLSDFSYTRPRQSTCVLYNPTLPLPTPTPACPTS
jgi:Flp pilus assembly protein TadG